MSLDFHVSLHLQLQQPLSSLVQGNSKLGQSSSQLSRPSWEAAPTAGA